MRVTEPMHAGRDGVSPATMQVKSRLQILVGCLKSFRDGKKRRAEMLRELMADTVMLL